MRFYRTHTHLIVDITSQLNWMFRLFDAKTCRVQFSRVLYCMHMHVKILTFIIKMLIYLIMKQHCGWNGIKWQLPLFLLVNASCVVCEFWICLFTRYARIYVMAKPGIIRYAGACGIMCIWKCTEFTFGVFVLTLAFYCCWFLGTLFNLINLSGCATFYKFIGKLSRN